MAVFTAPRPVVVGHRGAPWRARENTPAAFAAAAAEGARWVELDARRAADGAVVVHHEPVTADGVPIVERDATALAALGVARLDGVLDGLPPGLGVDVECKNLPGEPDYDDGDALAGLVAAVLAPRVGSRPLCATSFNPSTILACRALLPNVPAGLLAVGALALDGAAEVAAEIGATLVCPHLDVVGLDAEGVAGVHARGLEVLVWTVDDVGRARDLAAAGVDALCTNDPATLAAALGS